MDTFRKTYFLFLLLQTVVSCSVIDDDLSDCYEEGPQAQVDYELKLVTNLTTELTTQLTTLL